MNNGAVVDFVTTLGTLTCEWFFAAEKGGRVFLSFEDLDPDLDVETRHYIQCAEVAAWEVTEFRS